MTINYYIHPVNEYENTDWKVYENYMESEGYDDPVCSGEVCKGQPTGYNRPISNPPDMTWIQIGLNVKYLLKKYDLQLY